MVSHSAIRNKNKGKDKPTNKATAGEFSDI